jgi:hypothetical protein
MKLYLILLIISISNICYARDAYIPKSNWNTVFVTDTAHIKSTKYLTNFQITIVVNTFEDTEKRFFSYFNIDKKRCRLNIVNIIVVENPHILNNKNIFPNEDVYSDNKPGESKIVFGRYFSITNNLYIIPINLKKYYWRSNFAHELLHYFFDECNITFDNINIEHKYIDNFLIDNQDIFY